jgi:hypothetical protein
MLHNREKLNIYRIPVPNFIDISLNQIPAYGTVQKRLGKKTCTLHSTKTFDSSVTTNRKRKAFIVK